MSVEKTLKKQARNILAKGNWQKSILGFLCVCSVLSIIFTIVDQSTMLITDDILSKPLNLAIIIAVSLLCGIGLILLTPIYTGYLRFIANSKNAKTGDVQDIFYYFKKGKYVDTVQFNLALFLRYAVFLIICALPVTACFVFMQLIPEYELAFKIGSVWLGIIAVPTYCFVSRFWVMAQYLYVTDFDYRKEKEIVKASHYFVKNNFSKVISLYISFIPYALLCFFVIPIVFVYPYFKHTTFLSYSYIYELETANPQSPYFKQATESPEADEVAENTANDEQSEEADDEIIDKATSFAEGLTEINNDKIEENTTEFDNN